jgi:AcrR family transcriptional regulator
LLFSARAVIIKLRKWGDDMAFSKGKRIEDETSTRIIEIATNIGCREGANALTVTRLCREINCDRRVVYNRFRDIDEINYMVALKCNNELIEHSRKAINPADSYIKNFNAYIESAFAYIYEKDLHFQYYTALYTIEDDKVKNEFLNDLVDLINEGKANGYYKNDADSKEGAENIWFIIMGISGMLASNDNYKYKDALNTMIYGVNAVSSYIKL